MTAKLVAGADSDPLAGLGTATAAPPAPPAQAEVAPVLPPEVAPVPVATGAGQPRRNPGRLIGGRADASLAARFDQVQQALQVRLSNPNLSINDIMLVVLERTVREGEESIESLAQDLERHMQAKLARAR